MSKFTEVIEDGYIIRTYPNGLVTKTLIGGESELPQPAAPHQPTNQEIDTKLNMVLNVLFDMTNV